MVDDFQLDVLRSPYFLGRGTRDEALHLLDELVREALRALFNDVCRYPHLVREREQVNRFVFAHLVKAFIREGLDLTQIGIEFPVRVFTGEEDDPESKLKSGRSKDLVIWSHSEATLWSGCKPLSVIEWKCSNWLTGNNKCDYAKDINFLKSNTPGKFASSYAVHVFRGETKATLECTSLNPDNPEPMELKGESQVVTPPDPHLLPAGLGAAKRIHRMDPWCDRCSERHPE